MKFISILIILLFFLFSCTDDQSLDPELNKSLKLISPNGGEIFYANTYLYIPVKWAQKDIEKIDILYSIDYLNNWKVIGDRIPASLEIYSCSFQNIIADSIRLRIRDSKDENVFDDSDKFFSIIEDDPYGLGKVKILTPKAGFTLVGWDIDTISWSYNENIKSVYIYYSVDNGNSWKTIVSDTEIPSGKYGWLVPNINTHGGKIMLTARTGLQTRTIESEGAFSIQQRQLDDNILNYFPLNIGDVKIYKRKQREDHQDFDLTDFILKQTVVAEEFLDNQKYFHFREDIINLKTSAKSNRNIYYRVDTSSKIVYWHSLNPDGIFIHLGLFPNEVFEIGTEHYTTLKEQNSIQLFNENFESKSFFRGDIYGYSGHWIELLEGIGVFAYSYSADYGFSVRDTLTSAVVNGKVYGDTTWVY